MGKIITFTLDPDNPSTISDEAREKLENLTDEEIDDSDDDMPERAEGQTESANPALSILTEKKETKWKKKKTAFLTDCSKGIPV